MPVHDHGARPYDWVGDWAGRRAQLSPDSVGLRDVATGERYTYRELNRRANRTARLLREHGVVRGDGRPGERTGGRVVTLSRNRPELVDLFFATGKTGGVLAPLSHRLAAPELAELLDDVAPELLVVEAPFADLAADVLDAADHDPPILMVGADGVERSSTSSRTQSDDAVEHGSTNPRSQAHEDAAPTAETDPAAYLPTARAWAAALPDDAAPVETAEVTLSDPHLFLHTGGSTGLPKETVLTHGSVLWNAVNTVSAWGLRDDDATPLTFPMFHTGGWNVLTVPLFHMGGTVWIDREVDAGRLLDLIDGGEATTLVAVPAVLRGMVEHDDWARTDLSSLRLVKSGGGPCRERIMGAWWDRGVDLSQGYGLTECGPNNFAMPDGWPREKADTVGVPAPAVDARVVDEDGTELPPGEVGELELASPHAADRYWNAPEETAATFGARDGEAHGWVSTGDLAAVDEDGYYAIEGRKKNMYVSGGENVYPPEVEDAVADHPDVAEVVVVPVPDEQWGQVGKAVVEPADGRDLTVDALRGFLDDRLARFKHPRDLAFVDAMPTSGPDKIDRAAVEERFGGG
jgi:fatty-acyl-CoA synthase